MTTDPIPSLSTTVVVGHTFRYQANASTSAQGITKAQLLNSMISNNASSTANSALIKSMKINRICMYAAATVASSGVPFTQLLLEWLSQAGQSIKINRTVLGVSDVAVIDSKSPARSLASFWFDSGINEGDVMFNLTAPAGTVIDVSVSMAIGNDTNARIATTSASGTAGLFYLTYLDGPRGGAIWVPVGFQSLN